MARVCTACGSPIPWWRNRCGCGWTLGDTIRPGVVGGLFLALLIACWIAS